MAALSGCSDTSTSSSDVATKSTARNVIFLLGDGMGMTTLTATRIYKAGEDGSLTIDTLPETGFVKTYSNDAQVTDSAPSMSAYMTGVKMKLGDGVDVLMGGMVSLRPSSSPSASCGRATSSGASACCPPGTRATAHTSALTRRGRPRTRTRMRAST